MSRTRLQATAESRNDFLSSFKALSVDHVKVTLLGGITSSPAITMTAEGFARISFETDLNVGDEFIVYRETPIDSSDIYVEGQPLRAASLNAEHSRTAMMLQEMQQQVSDAIHKTDLGDDASMTLPSLENRKNKFLYFDETGSVQVSSSGSEWVSELDQLHVDVAKAIEDAKVQVQSLNLPLDGDKIADQAITQEKIDPSVRLGGLSAGSNSLIRMNANVIEEDILLDDGYNGMSAGPIRIKAKNELYRSEEFTESIWLKQEINLALANETKPDAIGLVHKVSASSTSSVRHYMSQPYPYTVSVGDVFFAAIYVKKAELDSVRLSLRTHDTHVSGSGVFLAYADFDLTNIGVDAQVELANAGIEDVGHGWYRCWLISNPLNVSSELIFTAYLLDLSGNVSFTNNDGHGLFISGAQILRENAVDPYFKTENDQLAGYKVTVNGVWSIV